MEQYYFYLLIGSVLALGAIIWLISHPVWIIYTYVFFVPLLPPAQFGELQISVLDFLTIPAVIYLISSNKRILFEERISTVFLFYILFAFLSFLNFSFYSQEISAPILLRWVRLVEMLIPALLAYQLRDKLSLYKIISVFLFSGILTAITAFIMFLRSSNLCESQTFSGGEVFRAAGTHCDTSSFGNLMGTIIIITFWIFVFWKKIRAMGFPRYGLFLGLSAALLCSMALMLSSSRGGVLQIVCGILFLMFASFQISKVRGKHLLIAGATVFCIVSLIIYLNYLQDQNELFEIAISSFTERFTNLSELGSSFDDGTSGRAQNWGQAIDLFINTPMAWVFGLGYKVLIVIHDIPPDNNFLQAFVEMGFAGFVSLVLFLFLTFKFGVQLYREEKSVGALILAIWIGIAFSMLFVDVMVFWHNIPVYLVLLMSCYKKDQAPSFRQLVPTP